MSRFKIFLITISCTLILSAQSYAFNTKDFSIALGAQYSSLLKKRGIITYGSHQIIPIFSVQLFDPNLLLAGSALYYKIPISGDSFFLRTRLNFNSTNDEPLYETDEDEDERISRDATSEFDLFIEKHFEDDSFLRLQISKDFVAHHGSYGELYGRLSIIDVVGAKKPLLDLGVFSSIGYGSKEHNEYLYGTRTDIEDSSLNNFEYGITLTSPKVIDSFWPTLSISSFQILGKNSEGSLVKERNGAQIELLLAFKVW